MSPNFPRDMPNLLRFANYMSHKSLNLSVRTHIQHTSPVTDIFNYQRLVFRFFRSDCVVWGTCFLYFSFFVRIRSCATHVQLAGLSNLVSTKDHDSWRPYTDPYTHTFSFFSIFFSKEEKNKTDIFCLGCHVVITTWRCPVSYPVDFMTGPIKDFFLFSRLRECWAIFIVQKEGSKPGMKVTWNATNREERWAVTWAPSPTHSSIIVE